MESNEKIKLMAEVARTIIDYLQDEIEINNKAIGANTPAPVDQNSKVDHEVQKWKDMNTLLLNDRNRELSRHISVIKRMYPNE